MSTSSNELTPTTPPAPTIPGKKNGRPLSAESKLPKMKNKGKSPKGIMKMFKRDKAKENGVVPVRPSCFNDDFVRRPESPDSPSRGSSGLRAKSKEEHRPYGLWRPKGKGEWESDSGRTLTLRDMDMSKLSKVELLALQRVAISQLQNMNIAVSHALVGVSKKGRLSFNTFNKRRISNEKTEPTSGIFGQPIDKVAKDQQPRSGSNTPGTSTPVLKVGNATGGGGGSSGGGGYQPPSSPTNSEASFLDQEPNPTAALLEALSKTDKATAPPSPKTQRQLALVPSEPRVPPIVRKAIELLDQKAVKTEGLFRISGSKARIDEIRRRFDEGQDVELSDANPHDVASVLKEFFRSLPEPLMTRELYGPFLSTRKLPNSGQRRDALRLTCLLLPQANRDTLQELLQFLSRVAMHSDGIILLDGTEESGNRMTEQNLGMIIGPNILHKERRVAAKGDYQVVKQDQEELGNVCKVMEDLIRMHLSIFTIPAELYDQAIKQLLISDPEAVDSLLKRKCMDQGLYNSMDSSFSRSRSSEAIRRTSGSTNSGLRLVVPPPAATWRRSRSFSDTEKTLDEAIRELDNLQMHINDDLELAYHGRHRHYSSNDSAMGESELMMSPVPSASSEPSTLTRARHIFRNRSDSAFSNNTSPTNSSEGVNTSDLVSLESDSTFIHQRNHSTLSAPSEPDHRRTDSSPVLASSPDLTHKGQFSTSETVSLPTFSPEREISPNPHDMSAPDIPRASTLQPHRKGDKSKHHKRKLRTLPSITSTGTYSQQRSPVLESKNFHFSSSEAIQESSSGAEATFTPLPSNSVTVHSGSSGVELCSANGPQSLHSETSLVSDEGTVI